ncbi:Anks3, partial [Symbiodinium sp. KB8]
EKKWSAIKSTAEGLMQSIVGFKTASLAILSNDNRWSIPLPTNFGAGVLPAVLAITDREAVLSVRAPEYTTGSKGSSAASSAEVGLGQPEKEKSSLAADLANAKSNNGISWAKSYNLAWRRATTSSARKTKQQEVRMGPGLLIAIIETDGEGEGDGGPARQQPPLFFVVAEKFSVSVMFSKVHCVQINGHPCLQWVYEENNCVESTLFFLSFHGACCRGLRLRVGYTVLSPDMSHLLLPEWRTEAEGGHEIRVASVLTSVNHVFVMTAECHPSAAISTKPQSGRKAKAKAAKRKAQAKHSSRKRKDAPEEDANEADVDPPNILDYIEDNDNFLDDVEIATEAENSDDDNTAKHEMNEVNEASAAAATDPARLPSSKNVFAMADDIHRSAELVPEGAVEEEALLLLVRRARSQKTKNMGVGTIGSRSAGHILPGETSTQLQPHMSSQLPEESGALLDEASSASQRQPGNAEGVLGECQSETRSAEVSASDIEADLDAELPHDMAAVLRSKAMADLRRDGHVLTRWVMACHLMLEAMHEYAKTKDVPLGHGLVGRQGREVKLDDDGKVLFSVADCTMYRTGISNGIGYPELCLDDRHAHVLLPFVRAAMRKVKRINPDRDAVSPHFLRLRDFCEYMLTSVSQITNLNADDEIRYDDQDRCHRSQVSRAAYIPCVAQHMLYTRTSQCQSVHWVARVARATCSIDSLKVKGKTRLETCL